MKEDYPTWGEGVLREYLKAQMEEMLRHKWIESEKAGRDLGEACILAWIKMHAAEFRKEFCFRRSEGSFRQS